MAKNVIDTTLFFMLLVVRVLSKEDMVGIGSYIFNVILVLLLPQRKWSGSFLAVERSAVLKYIVLQI